MPLERFALMRKNALKQKFHAVSHPILPQTRYGNVFCHFPGCPCYGTTQ